ncbi:peptidylprolyl isomerase [Candidatus Woesearchaeota archaeon]|nr:peptidylprolyl isomerase [Candidatus Woesearchaeota archaeon]
MADDKHQDEDYIEINIPQEGEPLIPDEPLEVKEPEEKKQKPKKKATKKKTPKKPVTPKKKKKAKKPKPKKKAPAKEAPSSNWLWALLLVIGLLIIAAVIYLSLQQTPTETGEEQRVAALVNNQPIYWDEVEQIYDTLPPTVQAQADEEVILEQLIEQELLLQEAEEQGYKVTDEELDDYTASLLDMFGMTEAQLENSLALQGTTREAFDENNKKQLLVSKLINDTVYSEIIVTDEDLEAAYNESGELYEVPEQAIIRHILLAPEGNETAEALEARAADVKGMIADDFNNFCTLVTNYSDDGGSIATCGEYAVAQNGQYVEAFEEAAFDMDVNETAIVETQFGQHIMWKVDHWEATTQTLNEVRDELEAVIVQERGALEVRRYIDELRDDATIEKYPKEGLPPVTAPLTAEEEEAQEEEVQVEVEDTKPVREGNFGKCLAEQGAVLYGVSWAPDVDDQKGLLGGAFDEITYVDCDPTGGEASAACNDITVYPTWIIGEGDDALVLQGKQTINALTRETGCAP